MVNVPEFGYTLESLRSLPTLSVGQADDLKFDKGGFRVWLCRCGIEDGMPFDNAVTIEQLVGHRWTEVAIHEAKPREEYGLLAQLYLGGWKR